MPLKCEKCGTEWQESFSLPMLARVFVKKAKAVACPKCGAKNARILPKGDFWVDD